MKHTEFKKAAPAGPAGTDCYALIGLEERFAVDSAELERRYLERSKEVHPDRFVTAPAHERVNALQQTMQLNEAYKTLKKPVARAEYLLRRHGMVIRDNEQLDPAFLMEILELREELQEAKLAGETAKLRVLEASMVERRDAALARVAERFAAFEQDGDRSALEIIKKDLILLRYIQRYLEELEDDFEYEEGEA